MNKITVVRFRDVAEMGEVFCKRAETNYDIKCVHIERFNKLYTQFSIDDIFSISDIYVTDEQLEKIKAEAAKEEEDNVAELMRGLMGEET